MRPIIRRFLGGLVFAGLLFSGLVPTAFGHGLQEYPVGDDPDDDSTADSTSLVDRFSLEGYGIVNYFNFDWETDPQRRNVVDLERFVLYPSVRLAEGVTLLGEIEFEHGGTGITKEFDVFEEAGEFENEVEAGGEILLEQLNVTFELRDDLRLRVGRFKIPVGLQAVNDEPLEYFTTTRSEMEAAMIPVNWYEIGVQVEGSVGSFAYSASVVNSLNSAEFSSENWIQRGSQKKFEEVAAENFAGALRLDYRFGRESFAGVSGFFGDSADNRRKTNLITGQGDDRREVNAYVSVVDAHVQIREGPYTARGVVVYGHLQNSDVVSEANRNLPRLLNAKGTPVGAEALGYLAEGGVDVLSFFAETDQRLDVFGRYEFYDTLYSTEGSVSDDAFWQRSTVTGGLNWAVARSVVFKAQYSRRVRGRARTVRGAAGGDTENTFSIGMGVQF